MLSTKAPPSTVHTVYLEPLEAFSSSIFHSTAHRHKAPSFTFVEHCSNSTQAMSESSNPSRQPRVIESFAYHGYRSAQKGLENLKDRLRGSNVTIPSSVDSGDIKQGYKDPSDQPVQSLTANHSSTCPPTGSSASGWPRREGPWTNSVSIQIVSLC